MGDIDAKTNWPVVTGPVPGLPAHQLYTTRNGDSLSLIAKRFLGNPDRWPEIYNLNKDQLSHPDQLDKNIILRIPVGPPVKVPQPPRGPVPVAPADPLRFGMEVTCNVTPLQAGIPAAEVCFTSYTVKAKDSLSSIAQTIWGKKERWIDLYRANVDKLPDPESISPGTLLKIPGEEEIKALRAAPLAAVDVRKALPKEREMLARAVAAEARGTSLDTQMAIATAIRNYATNNAVSIPKLVRSPYLSSNYDNNSVYFELPVGHIDSGVWRNALAAADDAFKPDSTGRLLIGDRDHFYDDSIHMPSWGKKSSQVRVGPIFFLNER